VNCYEPVVPPRSAPESLTDVVLQVSYQNVDTFFIVCANLVYQLKALLSSLIVLALWRHSLSFGDVLSSGLLMKEAIVNEVL
jgi:hypothetical protein